MNIQADIKSLRPARPAISVDGVEIPREVIAREAQYHAAATPAQAYAAAARALVIHRLLLNRADRLGLIAVPLSDEQGRRETDDEALIRQVIERDVVTPQPDEASCRRYYIQNAARFRTPDLYEASHIMFAAHPRDHQARALARSDAEAVLATLKSQPQTFDALARAHSACSSGRDGGRLGQVMRGQTTAEIDRVLARLESGAIADAPVETRYGFHIVRLDHRIDGQPMPFEAVHGRIAGYLADSVRRRALAQYISILAGQATVTGVDLAGSANPLVQ
jgi:peptidyl-prolyl cis-trans isomerase C